MLAAQFVGSQFPKQGLNLVQGVILKSNSWTIWHINSFQMMVKIEHVIYLMVTWISSSPCGMTDACALCPQVPSACSPSATYTGAVPGLAALAAWPRSVVMLAPPLIATTFPCSLGALEASGGLAVCLSRQRPHWSPWISCLFREVCIGLQVSVSVGSKLAVTASGELWATHKDHPH